MNQYVDEVDDFQWWTWANGTKRAHLRYKGSLTVCGRGPVWYAGDGEGFTTAPEHLTRCGTCTTIAGRLPGMRSRLGQMIRVQNPPESMP